MSHQQHHPQAADVDQILRFFYIYTYTVYI